MTTVLPDFDFETYSEAGYEFDPASQCFKSISKSPPHGLGAVGAWAYSEHPSTDVLCLAYDLKDAYGRRLWAPGMPPPTDLFDHVLAGRLLEAWNSFFEFAIWRNVCRRRYGFPDLPLHQLRCAMAKSRAYSLPGKLEVAGKVVGATDLKQADGKRLIQKFGTPRKPTKNNPSLRVTPADDPADGQKLYEYCLGDIAAESDISSRVPDMRPDELELWQIDQRINARGIGIDVDGLNNCLFIVEQATEKYNAELRELTGGKVQTAAELDKLREWLNSRRVYTDSVDAPTVAKWLANPMIPPDTRRVLEIRAALSSASVKKCDAILRRLSADNRIRDLFIFYGAHTGRWTGAGPQPHNLPKAGPDVSRCDECRRFCYRDADQCVYCWGPTSPVEWSFEAVTDALNVIASRDLSEVERVFGDALATVAGCLRGLFVAGPDAEFICSDFSAIEAVVNAALAGEQWRLDVFKSHGKIYEASAAKITGIPFADFVRHKQETGEHHPMRNKIGKFAELASGYQGSVGAWKSFGADKHMDDDEILEAVRKWRAESPAIVRFWYGLQDAAHAAVLHPGQRFHYRDISYEMAGDCLRCALPSGRYLYYHKPRLLNGKTPWGKDVLKLTFECWNTNPKKGPYGWIRTDTYGGKLVENVVQAVARDLLAYAMRNLERAGYPIVLHVHDEIAAEVAAGTGSVDEFERIMATLPAWASDWPVKASGGWRGKRYRKD